MNEKNPYLATIPFYCTHYNISSTGSSRQNVTPSITLAMKPEKNRHPRHFEKSIRSRSALQCCEQRKSGEITFALFRVLSPGVTANANA